MGLKALKIGIIGVEHPSEGTIEDFHVVRKFQASPIPMRDVKDNAVKNGLNIRVDLRIFGAECPARLASRLEAVNARLSWRGSWDAGIDV